MSDETPKDITVEEYLSQAQEPGLAKAIDYLLDQWNLDDGTTDRQRLRAHMLLLRDLGLSVQSEELDARRQVEGFGTLPPFRECIGALMHVHFDKS